jgi:hypothetical protein
MHHIFFALHRARPATHYLTRSSVCLARPGLPANPAYPARSLMHHIFFALHRARPATHYLTRSSVCLPACLPALAWLGLPCLACSLACYYKRSPHVVLYILCNLFQVHIITGRCLSARYFRRIFSKKCFFKFSTTYSPIYTLQPISSAHHHRKVPVCTLFQEHILKKIFFLNSPPHTLLYKLCNLFQLQIIIETRLCARYFRSIF